MLVGAFEIQIGLIGLRPMAVDRLLDGEDVGRTGIEPDVEDVLDLLVIVRVLALTEEARGRRVEPGIGAFGIEGIEDALLMEKALSTGC